MSRSPARPREWPAPSPVRDFASLRVGDAVAPLSVPVTLTNLVIAAGGERDFNPLHHDRSHARSAGLADAFMNTLYQQGLCNRFVNDWAGTEGELIRLRINMRRSIYVGQLLTIAGTVTSVRLESGRGLVELDLVLSTEDGPCTIADATMALPLNS
jgi:acyl dehydratase